MDIKNQETSDLKRKIKAHIPSKDIGPQVDKKLQEKGKTAVITGFRKGHAPLSILRQKYGQQVMSSVFEEVVSSGVDAYVHEHKLKVAGQPKITLDAYDEKKGLDITVEFDLLPELDLPKLEKIKLQRLIVENPEERLDDAMLVFAKQHSVEKPLKKQRPAKLNDVAVIDFEGFVDGKAFDGGKGKDHPLKLGSGQFIPGFEDQIVGKKKGESFDVNVSFPKNYHAKNLAGKDSTFKVTLTDLKESHPAEVNEELAKKSGFKTLDDLKDAMKKHLREDAQNTERRYLKRQLLVAISENLKGSVPQDMLDRESKAIWSEYERARLSDKSLEKISEEDFKKKNLHLAKSRILLGLALAELGNTLNVQLDKKVVENELMRYAQQYPGQEEHIFKTITSNKQALMEFQAPLYEDAVVDEALKKVTFTDKKVTLKELLKAIDTLEEDALKKLESSKKKEK